MASQSDSERPIPNSYWVVPGKFAAGEYPGDLSIAKAVEKVRSLLLAGVNHFIDLTEEYELERYSDIVQEEAARMNLPSSWERHPIRDTSTPSEAQMAAILDAIDGAMADGESVYVHCWGGVGRTGTVVGCWLIRHGHSGQAALDQVGAWFKEMTPEKVVNHPWGSPEYPEQKLYVLDWSDR